MTFLEQNLGLLQVAGFLCSWTAAMVTGLMFAHAA